MRSYIAVFLVAALAVALPHGPQPEEGAVEAEDVSKREAAEDTVEEVSKTDTTLSLDNSLESDDWSGEAWMITW
ncbi:hypothetical protein CBER1_08022 [Cercospora berteroae]|uniref:Uncharacterized protein n=1 Tax=Cercospora berteroae TaxID=357750 RepID=A0A2S6C6Z4_9PEZI|nr:hypothetical protein CBER1_08022 [Cercospora berteroae]